MSSDVEQPQSFDHVIAEEFMVLRGHAAGTGSDDPPLTALCISGGGIRSATFGLGAIQGLADLGVLTEFDYLSTVSGGGYIGGWLTSWKQRAGGLSAIQPKLRPGCPPPESGSLDPIGHLRQYNNYLSPKLGFLSADAWTLAATVIRNMTLNWLVLIPLLLFALMAPRLILAVALLKDQFQPFYGSAFPHVFVWPIRLVSSFFLAAAIFNTMRYLPGVGRKDHTEKDFLRYCLGPLIFAALSFMTYDAWFDPSLADAASAPPFGQMVIWFTASCAAGWIAYLAFCVGNLKRSLRLLAGPLSIAIVLAYMSAASCAWLLVTDIFPVTTWPSYITLGPPLFILSFMAAGGLFVGLTSHVLGDEDREWLSRGAAWMLLFVVCWTAGCGLVLLAPSWILNHPWRESSIAATGGVAGWLCSLAGFSSKSAPGNEPGPANSGKTASGGLKNIALDLAAKLAAPVFVAALLAGLAILTNWLMSVLQLVPVDWTGHENFVGNTRTEYILAVALAFLALGWVAAWFININKFSLNAMYRNRLIRAYLGASNDRSKENRFTGFADTDNIHMAALTPQLKPFHVVNMTLNLVGGQNLAWQQRKAESFTVSPLHSGSARLGYRPSGEYGGQHGISLGTAITISGAAVSPNMGYHSSGVIGFIMTLFNARLGAWLGNPGPAGQSTWKQEGPRSAISSLVREAFGRTNDACSYVYLSDGGHFENLGLYEMVMRRCRQIVVLDSGCDPGFTFDDLGNALRKIRIDMGISIQFHSTCIKEQRRWAYATIPYTSDGSGDGVLIHIKPMMTGDEPPDVAAYHASHCDFPHQSTANQFYDEAQTESYRMLGLHTIQKMCEGWNRAGGLTGMFDFLAESSRRAAAGGR